MPLGDECRGRHHLARRAVPALERVMLEEGPLHRMQLPVGANPSIVITSVSATATASVMQASTRRPATCTVHAPHSPLSQPFFVPVSPSRSRNASTSVTRGSNTITCALPLTRNVTSRSSSNLTPRMYLPVSPADQEASAYHRTETWPTQMTTAVPRS